MNKRFALILNVLFIIVFSLLISGCAAAPTEAPTNVSPVYESRADEVPIGQHFMPFDPDYGDLTADLADVPFDPLYVQGQPAAPNSYDDVPIGQHFVPIDPDFGQMPGDMDTIYEEAPFDPLYKGEPSE